MTDSLTADEFRFILPPMVERPDLTKAKVNQFLSKVNVFSEFATNFDLSDNGNPVCRSNAEVENWFDPAHLLHPDDRQDIDPSFRDLHNAGKRWDNVSLQASVPFLDFTDTPFSYAGVCNQFGKDKAEPNLCTHQEMNPDPFPGYPFTKLKVHPNLDDFLSHSTGAQVHCAQVVVLVHSENLFHPANIWLIPGINEFGQVFSRLARGSDIDSELMRKFETGEYRYQGLCWMQVTERMLSFDEMSAFCRVDPQETINLIGTGGLSCFSKNFLKKHLQTTDQALRDFKPVLPMTDAGWYRAMAILVQASPDLYREFYMRPHPVRAIKYGCSIKQCEGGEYFNDEGWLNALPFQEFRRQFQPGQHRAWGTIKWDSNLTNQFWMPSSMPALKDSELRFQRTHRARRGARSVGAWKSCFAPPIFQ